jgi:hypothetical protein
MRVFKEEQRFTQTWFIVLLIISTLPAIIIVTNTFIKSDNLSVLEYIGIISFIIAVTGLVFTFKLETKIDEIGIHYQFLPFHFKMKTILWKNIRQANTRKYDALSEFGGWGLRGGLFWKNRNGIAINVKGKIGIQLVLNDGKKILIGTQKKDAVDVILAKYSNKI